MRGCGTALCPQKLTLHCTRSPVSTAAQEGTDAPGRGHVSRASPRQAVGKKSSRGGLCSSHNVGGHVDGDGDIKATMFQVTKSP